MHRVRWRKSLSNRELIADSLQLCVWAQERQRTQQAARLQLHHCTPAAPLHPSSQMGQAEIWPSELRVFHFSIPTQKSCWFRFSFLKQNSSPSTFKLLSKIHTDTISHPEFYLDLGNEFCLACAQILAIHTRLTEHLLCGKYVLFLPQNLFILQEMLEGNRKQKWFNRNLLTATTHSYN